MCKAAADRKPTYALVLAMLGDRSGVETLLEQVGRTPQWDKGWNYKGMGQFGNALSPLDAQSWPWAGRATAAPCRRSWPSSAPLGREPLFAPSGGGPGPGAAGRPVGRCGAGGGLAQPGIAGHVQSTIDAAITQETPGGTNAEQTRRESLREIMLARALYRCGDWQGQGEKTLRAYTADLRGHLAGTSRRCWRRAISRPGPAVEPRMKHRLSPARPVAATEA